MGSTLPRSVTTLAGGSCNIAHAISRVDNCCAMSYDHNNFNFRLDCYVTSETGSLFQDREHMNVDVARALYEEQLCQPHPENEDTLRCMIVTVIHDEMVSLAAKFKKAVGERGDDQEVFDFGEEALPELVDSFRERLGMPSEHRKKSH